MIEESILPKGWSWATLSDLGYWSGGGTPSKARKEFWTGGDIPWVSPKDMKTLLIPDTEDHLSTKALEETALKLCSSGTILIVVRSGILQRILPVAVCQVSVTMNQDMKALSPIDGVDSMYVAYYLMSSERNILSSCSKDGTTVASIESEALKAYPIPLSPTTEQRRTIEHVILGSAAVLLVWSSSAKLSEWVERHILFAQRLKKLIVPVVIDGTDLPATMIVNTIMTSQFPCTDIVNQLPPIFPQPESTDLLVTLAEQASHELIRVRKEAIDQAAEMLKRPEHREEVLAIVEYLAHNDLMMGVREKAQEALDADARRSQAPAFRSDASRHIIGVRCKKGHVTYFDKRHICNDKVNTVRVMRAGIELEQRDLTCGECGQK